MLGLEISETSKITGLMAHTLRDYENIGLIRDIKGNESGKRIYTEQELKWLQVIKMLMILGGVLIFAGVYGNQRRDISEKDEVDRLIQHL